MTGRREASSEGWRYGRRTVPWTAREHVMRETLQLAVPMRLHELAGMTPRRREQTIGYWAANAAEPIAGKGDVLQYGSRKVGAAAEVFNHLARGLAALAHLPGGVDFMGLHFEVPATSVEVP